MWMVSSSCSSLFLPPSSSSSLDDDCFFPCLVWLRIMKVCWAREELEEQKEKKNRRKEEISPLIFFSLLFIPRSQDVYSSSPQTHSKVEGKKKRQLFIILSRGWWIKIMFAWPQFLSNASLGREEEEEDSFPSHSLFSSFLAKGVLLCYKRRMMLMDLFSHECQVCILLDDDEREEREKR